ncbi:MAG: helix-turn-helix domain-containing protein [Phycisphaeraceae bacterium]|nr:helix-turn-helix domain-containing protein [Phycisphaeraceae bacterium]
MTSSHVERGQPLPVNRSALPEPELSLSPKELAAAVGLSESTLKRWVDSGVIAAAKTPGGHRRIPRSEAIRLIRDSKLSLVNPDLLGVQDVDTARDTPTSPGLEGLRLYELLRDGQERHARGLLISLYLSGRSVIEICDGPVREAMHRIGELWRHEESGIYREHRASDIMVNALNHLRGLLPVLPEDAPLAIGASPSGDPYVIPSLMASIVLESAGFRTSNMGPDLPLSALRAAAADLTPSLVWLSVSCDEISASTGQDALRLADDLAARRIAFVIGGRSRALIPSSPNAHHAMSMGELVAFAKGVFTTQ